MDSLIPCFKGQISVPDVLIKTFEHQIDMSVLKQWWFYLIFEMVGGTKCFCFFFFSQQPPQIGSKQCKIFLKYCCFDVTLDWACDYEILHIYMVNLGNATKKNPCLWRIQCFRAYFSFEKKKERKKSNSLGHPDFFYFSLFFPIGEGQTLTEFQMANTSCPTTDLWCEKNPNSLPERNYSKVTSHL